MTETEGYLSRGVFHKTERPKFNARQCYVCGVVEEAISGRIPLCQEHQPVKVKISSQTSLETLITPSPVIPRGWDIGDLAECVRNFDHESVLTVGALYQVVTVTVNSSGFVFLTVENDGGHLTNYTEARFKKVPK